VRPEEVEAISAAFKAEYTASWIGRKFTLDTSDLAPEQLVGTFLTRARPFLSTRDLLRF
jgi:hypothetical protein